MVESNLGGEVSISEAKGEVVFGESDLHRSFWVISERGCWQIKQGKAELSPASCSQRSLCLPGLGNEA